MTGRTGVAHVPTVRNANLQDLMDMLNEQRAHSIDLVVPAGKLEFVEGLLVLRGEEPQMNSEGVTDPNGVYHPTQGFDDQLADRLDIATTYLRRLRHGKADRRGREMSLPRLDLWDANVNGLLQGRMGEVFSDSLGEPGEEMVVNPVPADSRSFFLRLLKPEEGTGVARALLSDRFARLDNVDALLAVLRGLGDAGINPDTLRIYGDLSETKMYVHISAPEILAAAPGLLEGYRSPFDRPGGAVARQGRPVLSMEERIEIGRRFRESGRDTSGHRGFYEPGNEPLVHAGCLVTNSETGGGRWTIVPEITILQCANGMTMAKDGFARSHLGSRMDEGRVDWSADTMSKELSLVSAQTRDVIKAVLSTDYLESKVAELESKADAPIEKPEAQIEVVAKKFGFSQLEQEGILRHFLLGGSLTSGGVMNAVTSFSQTVADPDAAHELNSKAVDVLEFAYAMR